MLFLMGKKNDSRYELGPGTHYSRIWRFLCIWIKYNYYLHSTVSVSIVELWYPSGFDAVQ